MAIFQGKNIVAVLALLSAANAFTARGPAAATSKTALNQYQASFQWDGMTEGNMVRVEGETLRTCSFPDVIDDVKINLQSQGRPIFADVELWQTPTYVPWKVRVWSEDGRIFPFNAVIHTPKGGNAIQVKNTANVAMPLDAAVQIDGMPGMEEVIDRMEEVMPPRFVKELVPSHPGLWTPAVTPSLSCCRPMNATSPLPSSLPRDPTTRRCLLMSTAQTERSAPSSAP